MLTLVGVGGVLDDLVVELATQAQQDFGRWHWALDDTSHLHLVGV